MYKVQCRNCQSWFSRKDVMKRHQRNIHGFLSSQDNEQSPSQQEKGNAYPPPPPPPPPPPQESSHAYPPPPPPPPQESSHAYPLPPPPPPLQEKSHTYPPPPPPQESGHAYPPPPPQESSHAYPPSPQESSHAYPPPQQEDFAFKHPFTANVSGPTSCGKTYFVKTLLQNCLTEISPPPQRIIWLYKRWQPLYDIIKYTVAPSVEFIRGIPIDIEQDSFINPDIRNLVILDDLMSTASKDPRINELFTEGSHHRNLSVIAINQNLYFNKDPTQRRNCHYMVIFNNPVDKQQITTLVRQMYPGKSQHFIHQFEDAVAKPYGYLVVDLKPTTPESLRLRGNVFGQYIKEPRQDIGHSAQNTRREQTYSEESPVKVISHPKYSTEDKMPSCDDCGIVFENNHDLQKHIKHWCPDQAKRKTDDETVPRKKIRYERMLSEDSNDDSIMGDEDSSVYLKFAEIAKEQNEEEWQNKRDKYMDEGMSESEAEDRADMKLKEADLQKFMDVYEKLLSYVFQARNLRLHEKIMNTIERYIGDGIDQNKAIKKTLRKYKYEFEEYLDSVRDNDDEDTEGSDNEDVDETEEVSETDDGESED